MSYDLAVWEGQRPSSAAEAVRVCDALRDANDGREPTPAIRAYVEALLARYPDLADDMHNEDECPWSDAPLIGNAQGAVFYFAMVFSKAEEASAFAADLAKQHGLVCFDPQLGTLRP